MNEMLLACVSLLASASIIAAEQTDMAYFWRELARSAGHRMFLVSDDTIVCYARAAAPHDFFVLTRVDETFSIRRIANVVGAPTSQETSPDTQHRANNVAVSDISAGRDGEYTWISWIQQVDNVSAIHLVRIGQRGSVKHEEIKKFQKWKPAFNLNTYALGAGGFLFLYTCHSEVRSSPISDTGDIAKLWALRWQNGTVDFDRQLSTPGRVQTLNVQAREITPTSFDLVWTEDRHGLFGFRNRFATGRLTLTPKGPQVDNVHHVLPLDSDEARRIESIRLAHIAVDERGVSRVVISLHPRSGPSRVPAENGIASSAQFRLFALDGAVLRDLRLPSRSDALCFDTTSSLWRYIDQSLYRGITPASGEFHIHWTDFAKHEWTETFWLPRHKVAHLIQRPADCFYWLELGEKEVTTLKKVCRQSTPPT